MDIIYDDPQEILERDKHIARWNAFITVLAPMAGKPIKYAEFNKIAFKMSLDPKWLENNKTEAMRYFE